jgi:hypothetical protein
MVLLLTCSTACADPRNKTFPHITTKPSARCTPGPTNTDRAHACAGVVLVWFNGVIDRPPGTGTIGPPQVTPFWSDRFPSRVAEAIPDRRLQQLLSEQHECSQTARNGIPLRGVSEFSGNRQIVPCVTAQPVMQGLGSHTRTRVTKTSHPLSRLANSHERGILVVSRGQKTT